MEVRYGTVQYGKDNSRPIPEIFKAQIFHVKYEPTRVPIKQGQGKNCKLSDSTIYNTFSCSGYGYVQGTNVTGTGTC
jgi:hypothetical protein